MVSQSISSIRVPTEVSKLGDLKTTVGIDPIFAKYTIFIVKPHFKDDRTDNEFQTNEGIIKIASSNSPSFDAMGTYLAFLAAIERGHGKICNEPVTYCTVEIDPESGEEKTTPHQIYYTTLNFSQREACKLLGRTYGTNTVASIQREIDMLLGTTITEYDNKGVFKIVYRLLVNATMQGNGFSVHIDNTVISMCKTKNHRVHWQAILDLSGQVEKGIAIYLECNNRPGKEGIQYISETQLMKFLFNLDHPVFKPGALTSEQKRSAKFAYKLEMAAYDEKCVTHRKQVASAFNTLVNQGFIYAWDKGVGSVKPGLVNKNRFFKVTRKQPELEKSLEQAEGRFPNIDTIVEDEDNYPWRTEFHDC